jgi:chromate transporter
LPTCSSRLPGWPCGFGGVLAVIQREMVERKRWLTQEELEDWAVAQIMPGPNVVNLS